MCRNCPLTLGCAKTSTLYLRARKNQRALLRMAKEFHAIAIEMTNATPSAA
jgi:hypothetical protein